MGIGDPFPDLFLARMVIGYREGHDLLQPDLVILVEVEQLRRYRRELQPLLHRRRGHKEAGGDFFRIEALVAQRLESTELVERMQVGAAQVLGKRVLFRGRGGAAVDDTGDRFGFRQSLLLDEDAKSQIAPAAGGNFEYAGLVSVLVEDWADVQALKEFPPADILGELFDRYAVLYSPHILLRQHELVVGNVLRSVHRDFLNGLCHGQGLHDGRLGVSPRTSKPVKKPPLPPLPLGAAAASWQGNTAVCSCRPGGMAGTL